MAALSIAGCAGGSPGGAGPPGGASSTPAPSRSGGVGGASGAPGPGASPAASAGQSPAGTPGPSAGASPGASSGASLRPVPTGWSGHLPTQLTGTLIYLERYSATEQDGLTKTHEVAGDMNVRLKVDPAQSDASRTVWVDDAGSWTIQGTGFARGTDCTSWTEAYTGSGGFGFGAAPTWNPSVEGTATIQLVVDESAPAPTTSGGPFALLTFSLVGHIGENGVVQHPDGSCPTFKEDSSWSFPTSMAGGSLEGFFFTDPQTGIDYLGLKVPAPTSSAPSAFNDVVTTPESEWPIAELHAAP